MLLNNSEYKRKMSNRTIGIITDINIELQEIRCAFYIQRAIVDSSKKTHFFIHDKWSPREQNQ